MVILIERGGVRSLRAQCSIVAKPLLPVKQVVEAEHFAGFCSEGGFVLDPAIGNVYRFREEGGNYMLDTHGMFLMIELQLLLKPSVTRVLPGRPRSQCGRKPQKLSR